MAEEEEVTKYESKHNVLPAMTFDEVKASAQRILNLRGLPPYTRETTCTTSMKSSYCPFEDLSDDELRVLSEFVQVWLPFLVQPKA